MRSCCCGYCPGAQRCAPARCLQQHQSDVRVPLAMTVATHPQASLNLIWETARYILHESGVFLVAV